MSGVDGVTDDPEHQRPLGSMRGGGAAQRIPALRLGQFRSARVPLLDDAVSYTMSGRAAVARR